MTAPADTVRLAAIADIHCSAASRGKLQALFAQIGDSADLLLICGDITSYGIPEEAQVFAQDLSSALKIPALAVLGNHDYETGKQDEIRRILSDAGVTVLDGDTREVHGIGFAGVKGFGGGFGKHLLQPWGELSVKTFVHEALEESLKLESALARLRTPQRVILLHYSPVRSTVEGEPVEVMPFLGSSRLEEPLNRYRVTVVFHGHAHRGSPEGRTAGGVPVYNVAMPLLQKAYPDRPPFHLMEVSRAAQAGPATTARVRA